jgi:hypothetical protein
LHNPFPQAGQLRVALKPHGLTVPIGTSRRGTSGDCLAARDVISQAFIAVPT